MPIPLEEDLVTAWGGGSEQDAIAGDAARLPNPLETEQRPTSEPGFWELYGAAFREQNVTVASLDWLKHQRFAPNHQLIRQRKYARTGYNGLYDMPPDLWRYAEEFEAADTPDEAVLLTHDIRQEQYDQKILAEAGWAGVGFQVAAAVLDPLTLAPAAWEWKLGQLGRIATWATTGSRAAQAAKVAATGFVAETGIASLEEAVLQMTAYDRALQESMINIGGAGLMGSVVGGAWGGITAGRRIEIAQAIEHDIRRSMDDVVADQDTSAEQFLTLSEYEPTQIDPMARVVFGTEPRKNKRFTSWLTPLVRLQRSPSGAAVDVTDNLVQHRLLKKSNLEGRPSPIAVETEIDRMKHGYFAAAKRLHDEAFKLTRKAVEKISRTQFNNLVGQALRRGDKSDHPIDAIREAVEKSARAWRDKVFDPLTTQARLMGMLSDVNMALRAGGYFPRVYDMEKMADPDWMRMLTDTFIGEAETPAIAQHMAALLTRNIRHAPSSRLAGDDMLPEGFEGRTIPISDERLAPWLVDDVETVAIKFLHTYAPDVALHRRFGSIDMQKAIDRIDDDYDILMAKAKTESARKALARARDSDVEDITLLRDRLRGTDSMPTDPASRFFNNVFAPLRAVTSAVYLGGQTISALPDLGYAILQQNFGPVLKAFASRVMSKSFRDLSKQELSAIGVGIDNYLNSRSYALTFTDEAMSSGVTRGLTEATSRMSLMTRWNAALKSIVGTATQTRLLDDIDELVAGTLSKAKTARLAQTGIDADLAKRIKRLSDAHAYKATGGARLANTALWDDIEVANLFEHVTLKEVNTTIVTPGVADRPTITSNNFGKFILQFQSFLIGAHNQALLPTMQRIVNLKDTQVAAGLSTVLVLGLLQNRIKALTRGESPFPTDRDETPADLTKDAIDGSGILGMLPALYDWTDRLTAGNVSESLGLSPSWRAKRAPTLSDVSPSTSWVGGVLDAAQDIGQAASAGELPEYRTWRNVYRLAPFQNLFYARGAASLWREVGPKDLQLPKVEPRGGKKKVVIE